jgi:alpha/beta superfamily hydrolase
MPDAPPWGGAVICHAHPLFGGSKDHPLLWAVRIALARQGLAVLAFNFRGVMGSEGSHGGGVDEVMDATAAVGAIRERVPGPTLMVGWSFGANVALRAALVDQRVAALALLALPLAESAADVLPIPESLTGFSHPVLLVAGDDDPFCPAPELRAFAERIPKASVTIFKGTDHYFDRREHDAGELVGRFAAQTLPDAG